MTKQNKVSSLILSEEDLKSFELNSDKENQIDFEQHHESRKEKTNRIIKEKFNEIKIFFKANPILFKFIVIVTVAVIISFFALIMMRYIAFNF